MGKLPIIQRLKLWMAGIGWSLFIWGNDFTEKEYWKQIYDQESFGKVQEVGHCSLGVIETLVECRVKKNHTDRWGVLFGEISGNFSFMDPDKNKVLEWIRDNVKISN